MAAAAPAPEQLNLKVKSQVAKLSYIGWLRSIL
jgi:hypothetical protein